MGEWREGYLDLMLIPVSILLPAAYHAWLWRTLRLSPLRTTLGIDSAVRRRWLLAVLKENEKKGVLVVQSVRNVIMGSTLMATTAVLFCTGIAAVLSSTYAIKKPLSDAVFGAHGEYMLALKYVSLLLLFLLSFLFHSLAISFLNQATFLINSSSSSPSSAAADPLPADGAYVAHVLERGFLLNVAGNRLFYAGVPLLLWIFGPLLAFLASAVMMPILYNLDVVSYVQGGKTVEVGINGSSDHQYKCSTDRV